MGGEAFWDGDGTSQRGGYRCRCNDAHGGGGRGLHVRSGAQLRHLYGDLHRLADWFAECGVKTVVVESTGVYSIPIFELLDERGVEVFLVNARDAKHVPGRKTDVSDAQWLQRLHSHGLLRAAFEQRVRLLNYVRICVRRERLLDYAASHIQHMQKSLTEMNLQLHHVVSDITGATSMRIIRAIIGGERNPAVLALLRDTRCHASVGAGQSHEVKCFAAFYRRLSARIGEAKGRDCEGTQNRGSVLQRASTWDGLRRPRHILLRDTLPRARHRQSSPLRQGLRLHLAARHGLADFFSTNSVHRRPRKSDN